MPPAITGTGAIILPAITVSASGTQLLAITGTGDVILSSIVVNASGTTDTGAAPVAARGGDDAWRPTAKQARAYRKRVRDWLRSEEEFERARREDSERIARDIREIYERVVEGRVPAAQEAARAAVEPYTAKIADKEMASGIPAAGVDWQAMLADIEALRAVLRAYGEQDKALRAKRRANVLIALLMD